MGIEPLLKAEALTDSFAGEPKSSIRAASPPQSSYHAGIQGQNMAALMMVMRWDALGRGGLLFVCLTPKHHVLGKNSAISDCVLMIGHASSGSAFSMSCTRAAQKLLKTPLTQGRLIWSDQREDMWV